MLSQETDGVTIGEDQIRQIQDKDAASRLGADHLAQFGHTVCVKVTADREDNRSAARAMNFQHRPGRSERNCEAMRRGPEQRLSGRRGEANFRQW
jgi:predicted kinase